MLQGNTYDYDRRGWQKTPFGNWSMTDAFYIIFFFPVGVWRYASDIFSSDCSRLQTGNMKWLYWSLMAVSPQWPTEQWSTPPFSRRYWRHLLRISTLSLSSSMPTSHFGTGNLLRYARSTLTIQLAEKIGYKPLMGAIEKELLEFLNGRDVTPAKRNGKGDAKPVKSSRMGRVERPGPGASCEEMMDYRRYLMSGQSMTYHSLDFWCLMFCCIRLRVLGRRRHVGTWIWR